MDRIEDNEDESKPMKEDGDTGKKEATAQDLAKEQIVEAIGGFGKWQLHKSVFIVSVIWTALSVHLLNMVFFR